ncbi:hypothetical protein K402DRAFT_321593 [Aulographum hederae CBS 113979]|uniref:Uncharacterized protein n=1 Tax=Aulographum hederae CBS 113979 TaxID=1176131 RepID=A0A6G1HFT8_9PEZI|nr:hypothetical protein K402DRAFT_321593 [Aulographum hederae CBS 113979]
MTHEDDGPPNSEDARKEIQHLVLRPVLTRTGLRFSMSAAYFGPATSIDYFLQLLKSLIQTIFKSRFTALCYLIGFAVCLQLTANVFKTQPSEAGYDIAAVARMTKSFAPAVEYSAKQVLDVQEIEEASIAIWDLEESVRSSNITSAPLIIDRLHGMRDSLEVLGNELTRFFAMIRTDLEAMNDGMYFAQLELERIESMPLDYGVSNVGGNVYNFLGRTGLLEDRAGEPTSLGKVFKAVFGQTLRQQQKSALQRSFHSFVSTVEEALVSEITFVTALYSIFETVDRQFTQTHRVVLKELDEQERENAEILSTLWVKLVGPNPYMQRKFQRNKDVLRNLRETTVGVKKIIMSHNTMVKGLQSGLKLTQNRVVSPHIRAHNASKLDLSQQIKVLVDSRETLMQLAAVERVNFHKGIQAAREKSTAGSMGDHRHIHPPREIDGARY